MDLIERLLCKFLIWRFKEGYGGDCSTSDLDDFNEDYKSITLKERVVHESRCGSCRARETINFLQKHIDLTKM